MSFRQPLWAANWREYELVSPSGADTLHVTVARGGTGPGQVARVARRAEPRVFVPSDFFVGGRFTLLRSSGLTPGVRSTARLGAPNEAVPSALSIPASRVARADGTLELAFAVLNLRRLPDRDLSAAHDGQLAFRDLFGETVRQQSGLVQVLELGAPDATTVVEATRPPTFANS